MPIDGFARGLMVFAAISWFGKVAIHVFDERERIDNIRYRRLLHETVIPECRRVYPEGDFIYQQDGARAHVHKKTLRLLRGQTVDGVNIGHVNFIDKEEWPAQSPDLTPCDYRLWAWMESKV